MKGCAGYFLDTVMESFFPMILRSSKVETLGYIEVHCASPICGQDLGHGQAGENVPFIDFGRGEAGSSYPCDIQYSE